MQMLYYCMCQLVIPWEGSDSYKKASKLSCFKKEDFSPNQTD